MVNPSLLAADGTSPHHIARCGIEGGFEDPRAPPAAGTPPARYRGKPGFDPRWCGGGDDEAGQSRRVLNADTPPDWPAAEHLRELQLAPERFASSWHYDALGGLQQLTDARGNQRLWRYGVDGELARVELVFSSARRKVLLERRDCNAQGQVTVVQPGSTTQELPTVALNTRDCMPTKVSSPTHAGPWICTWWASETRLPT